MGELGQDKVEEIEQLQGKLWEAWLQLREQCDGPNNCENNHTLVENSPTNQEWEM